LEDGDILGLWTIPERADAVSARLKTQWFLVTERCNSYCLMCSQPPRNVDDDWIIDEIIDALPLIDPQTQSWISLGRAYSLGERFLEVLRRFKTYYLQTAFMFSQMVGGLLILLSLVPGLPIEPQT